jgi:hypothetical protein
MATKTKHVQLEGTHGLTLLQAKAIAEAVNCTLERDSWEKEGNRLLTPKQTKAAYDGLQKLWQAITWHEDK